MRITADAYVVAGARLHVGCRDINGASCILKLADLRVLRPDGTSRFSDVARRNAWTSTIELGEIAAGRTKEVKLVVDRVESDGDAHARLYVVANAWNAHGTSIAVALGGTERGPTARADMPIPANDDFHAAVVLDGEGMRDIDLLRSTVEPGELIFDRAKQRLPRGSVWFSWTAPKTELAWFEAKPRVHGNGLNDRARSHDVSLDVYEGDRIASLARLQSAGGNATFFAEAGRTYRIRVRADEPAGPSIFRWGQGGRPTNDDLADAVRLEGETGNFGGSNRGGTLEWGETFGDLAATVWHRWTAPDDGTWEFSVDAKESIVAVFVGNDMAGLRLVSNAPNMFIHVPAARGKEYQVLVATPTANDLSGDYRLSWQKSDYWRFRPTNDNFQDAAELRGEVLAAPVPHDNSYTVEPGEPAETGVTTQWWAWTAPDDGTFTIRLLNKWEAGDKANVGSSRHVPLQLRVFTGETLVGLTRVGRAGAGYLVPETTVDAARGQRFWISIGLPSASSEAFKDLSGRVDDAVLRIGPTPMNDRAGAAVGLAGGRGKFAATSRFATTEPGERLGHSSLWWTWKAPVDGWQRFQVDRAGNHLAVYRRGADGSLVLIRATRRTDDPAATPAEIYFKASAGNTYTIRLGVDARFQEGDDVVLSWAPSPAPVWLKYVGELSTGGPDGNGNFVEIRNPRAMAIHDRGKALYLASELGLLTFRRDPGTGRLAFVERLEGEFEASQLLWDSHRQRLIATQWCSPNTLTHLHRFLPVGDDPAKLAKAGRLAYTYKRSLEKELNCRYSSLLMDPTGSFLYLTSTEEIVIFALDAVGESIHDVQIQRLEDQSWYTRSLSPTVIDKTGGYLYSATDKSGALVAFERNVRTGLLTETSRSHRAVSNFLIRTIGISHYNAKLFAMNLEGDVMTVYGLDDPAAPVQLHSGKIGDVDGISRKGGLFNRCHLAARHRIATVDVVCGTQVFTMQWSDSSDELDMTDSVSFVAGDRFGNFPPRFPSPESMVASPDGGHLYISTSYISTSGSTSDGRILIFERIGGELIDSATNPASMSPPAWMPDGGG